MFPKHERLSPIVSIQRHWVTSSDILKYRLVANFSLVAVDDSEKVRKNRETLNIDRVSFHPAKRKKGPARLNGKKKASDRTDRFCHQH